jgi:hypothetical protein
MENRLSESKSFSRNFYYIACKGVSQGKYPEIAEKIRKKAKHPRPTGDSRTKKKFPVQHPPIYAIIIPQTQKEARPEDG